jgi:hypothetical protein
LKKKPSIEKGQKRPGQLESDELPLDFANPVESLRHYDDAGGGNVEKDANIEMFGVPSLVIVILLPSLFQGNN